MAESMAPTRQAAANRSQTASANNVKQISDVPAPLRVDWCGPDGKLTAGQRSLLDTSQRMLYAYFQLKPPVEHGWAAENLRDALVPIISPSLCKGNALIEAPDPLAALMALATAREQFDIVYIAPHYDRPRHVPENRDETDRVRTIRARFALALRLLKPGGVIITQMPLSQMTDIYKRIDGLDYVSLGGVAWSGGISNPNAQFFDPVTDHFEVYTHADAPAVLPKRPIDTERWSGQREATKLRLRGVPRPTPVGLLRDLFDIMGIPNLEFQLSSQHCFNLHSVKHGVVRLECPNRASCVDVR